jgi:hypothetical protein
MTTETNACDTPPTLPPGTRVDFEVECRTSPDSTAGERHSATLLEDWTVLTPTTSRLSGWDWRSAASVTVWR